MRNHTFPTFFELTLERGQLIPKSIIEIAQKLKNRKKQGRIPTQKDMRKQQKTFDRTLEKFQLMKKKRQEVWVLITTLAVVPTKQIFFKPRMSGRTATNKWNQNEDYLYYIFLKLKEQEFQSYAQRKSAKVFDYFAHLVGTKNRHQVKTHHNRLMKEHKTVKKYLNHYEEENSQRLGEFSQLFTSPKLLTIIGLYKQKGSLPVLPTAVSRSLLSEEILWTQQLDEDLVLCRSGIQTEDIQTLDKTDGKTNHTSRDDQDLSLQSFPLQL